MLSVAFNSLDASCRAGSPRLGVIILESAVSFSLSYVRGKLLLHMALEWFRAAVLPIVASFPMFRDKSETLRFKEM